MYGMLLWLAWGGKLDVSLCRTELQVLNPRMQWSRPQTSKAAHACNTAVKNALIHKWISLCTPVRVELYLSGSFRYGQIYVTAVNSCDLNLQSTGWSGRGQWVRHLAIPTMSVLKENMQQPLIVKDSLVNSVLDCFECYYGLYFTLWTLFIHSHMLRRVFNMEL